MLKNICRLAPSLLLSITLFAQSRPSAEGGRVSVWVGAAVSTFNPDYGCTSNSPFGCWDHQLLGIAPYVDANHLLFNRLGTEGEARFLHWRGPGSLTEASYLAGPRVNLWYYRNMMLSGKMLLGNARISLPNNAAGTGNYFAYAPGATVDFRLTRRAFGRVDYEYQRWPSFHGVVTGSGHGGLTPNGLSFGISYAILR